MEKFIPKLRKLLAKNFAGSKLELDRIGGGRVSGLLTWDGFVEVEQIERQRTVWRILRSKLTPEEQHRVAAILTLTPEEMTAARAS
jgi:acid stress-induced BolA-like protein IbaG/YrbA